MAAVEVIDLTKSSPNKHPVVINLANSSPAPAGTQDAPQQSEETNNIQKKKSKTRRRKKNKVTDQSDADDKHPNVAATHSESGTSQNKRPVDMSEERKSSYKRKRGESIDSEHPPHSVHNNDRRSGVKRQKSDHGRPLSLSPTPIQTPKGPKKKETQPKKIKPSSKSGNIHDSKKINGSGEPSNNGNSRRTSESPIPTKSDNSRRSTPRHRRSMSIELPLSPSALFFIDKAPTTENTHQDTIVKSAFRLEDGGLWLPEHVVLESTEEALPTPGMAEEPPRTPGSDIGSIDLVDDSSRHVRRYWEEEAPQGILEECRTCGQYHENKLCQAEDICFTCGSRSHSSRKCPYTLICHRCGKSGHIKAVCPMSLRESVNSRDCNLCGSQIHKTHNCSHNWRQYTYRSPQTREAEIEERLATKRRLGEKGSSYSTDPCIGLEPYCYNCAAVGHLGDDCTQETYEDRPRDNSAFGKSNLSFGPFAPKYDAIARDILRQMGPTTTVFGDQVLERISADLDSYHPDAPIGLPKDLPLRPGTKGRQRERDRLARVSKRDESDEEDNWFNNRRQRDDRRSNGGPKNIPQKNKITFASRMRNSPSPPPRARITNTHPSEAPRRDLASRLYPSSQDMASGYRRDDTRQDYRSNDNRSGEFNIKGAASRRPRQESPESSRPWDRGKKPDNARYTDRREDRDRQPRRQDNNRDSRRGRHRDDRRDRDR